MDRFADLAGTTATIEQPTDRFADLIPAGDTSPDSLAPYKKQVQFFYDAMKTNPEVVAPGFALTGFADPMGITSYVSKKWGTGELAAWQDARRQYVSGLSWKDPEKWKNLAVDFEKTILELKGMPARTAMGTFGLHSLLQAPTAQQTEEDWWTFLKEKGWEGAKSAATGKLFDVLGIVKNPVLRRGGGAVVGGASAAVQGADTGNILLGAGQGAVFTPYTGAGATQITDIIAAEPKLIEKIQRGEQLSRGDLRKVGIRQPTSQAQRDVLAQQVIQKLQTPATMPVETPTPPAVGETVAGKAQPTPQPEVKAENGEPATQQPSGESKPLHPTAEELAAEIQRQFAGKETLAEKAEREQLQADPVLRDWMGRWNKATLNNDTAELEKLKKEAENIPHFQKLKQMAQEAAKTIPSRPKRVTNYVDEKATKCRSMTMVILPQETGTRVNINSQILFLKNNDGLMNEWNNSDRPPMKPVSDLMRKQRLKNYPNNTKWKKEQSMGCKGKK